MLLDRAFMVLLLLAATGSAQAAQLVELSSCAAAAPSTCWRFSFIAGSPLAATADTVTYDNVTYYRSGGAVEGSSYLTSVTFDRSFTNSVSFIVPEAFYGSNAFYFVDSFFAGSLSRPLFTSGDYAGYSSPLGDSNSVRVSASGTTVPEPATWALLLIGFAGVGVAARLRAKRSAGTTSTAS